VARRIESALIAGPAGRLEALLEEPDGRQPQLAAVVCHPHPLYGGSMRNKVVYRLGRGLRRAGAAVLRFNFRGVGASQGSHGHLEGEIGDARAALDWQRKRYPELPFALAGFSFGAHVVTRLACETPGTRFVLAAGFATRLASTAYLESCSVPKIFMHSTHDQFGPRAEMEALYAAVAPPKHLVWIEAADHFFAGGLDQFEQAVLDFGGAPVPS